MASHLDRTSRVRRTTSSRVGGILLTLSAVIGAMCIVATVASVAFGVKPLVFRSGSMSPDIATGALALARTTDASDLEVGDVVSVRTALGARVTHRIQTVTLTGDTARLVLKGDANATADSETYEVRSAERVFFDVPRLGYVVAWTSSPAGIFLGGLVVGGAMLVLVGSAARRDRGGARRAAVVVGVLVIGVGASTVVAPQQTLASFTDNATVTTGSTSTYKLPAPTNFRCGALGLFTVTFSWDAVPGATGYTLHYGTNGTATLPVTGTTTTTTSVISGGTAWVTANRNFGSTTWTSAASNTRSYTVAVVSLCG